jgi:hypothetical protein
MLCRAGFIDDYSKRFMALSCHHTTLTEHQKIRLYITGLGNPLRTNVSLQQPTSLDDVVIFAQAYEQ